MSIDTVKLLYGDVDNTRFTNAQYTTFRTNALHYLYVLRPDLFCKSVSVPLTKDAAGLSTVSVPTGTDFIKFKGLIKDTENTFPRLVDYIEAVAKYPTWGRETGATIHDITEYTVDILDRLTSLYFDKFVPDVQAVLEVSDPSLTITVSPWLDEALDKYVLYLAYSSDSTSQQDQMLAQQYLQEFTTMVSMQRPMTMQDKSPYPMQTLARQAGTPAQGGSE